MDVGNANSEKFNSEYLSYFFIHLFTYFFPNLIAAFTYLALLLIGIYKVLAMGSTTPEMKPTFKIVVLTLASL